MKIAGLGDVGRYGGPPGNLYIRCEVFDEAQLTRSGIDVHSVLRLSVFDALLGAKVSVATTVGARELHVPQGAQHGDVLLLQHAGVTLSSPQGQVLHQGHHYFKVQVAIPDLDAMGQEQQHVLAQLAKLHHSRQPQDGRPAG